MIEKANKQRLWIFLSLAFGAAWLISLVIYLKGGLAESPMLIPSLNLSLAAALLAGGVMMAPALANLLTRLLTREGKADLWLRPARFGRPWRCWLLAWVLPAVGTILGAALYFTLFPSTFDRGLEGLRAALSAAAPDQNISPWAYLLMNTLQALLLAPILNALFCFGEEFGWRAYLLPKLLPLGTRKAVLLSGVAAAFIVAISRAVGETMIVAIAAGAGPAFTLNPFKAAETMTGHIVRISGGDLSYASIDYDSIFAIGLMLFLMTLVLNIVSRQVVRRFREVYE